MSGRPECLCETGYYSLHGPGHACLPCVFGGICEGGTTAPYPAEGFWGDKECAVFGGARECEGWHFLECEDTNCKGGPLFECTRGRRGRLCQEPEPGWFVIGGTFFVECGRHGRFVTVVAIVLVVSCWMGIEMVFGEKFPAVSVVLLFIQMASIIGEFRYTPLQLPHSRTCVREELGPLPGPFSSSTQPERHVEPVVCQLQVDAEYDCRLPGRNPHD